MIAIKNLSEFIEGFDRFGGWRDVLHATIFIRFNNLNPVAFQQALVMTPHSGIGVRQRFEQDFDRATFIRTVFFHDG
jgi:hypothetical protein